jgi:ribosomal protein S18 acetylase RimI-like enzyme
MNPETNQGGPGVDRQGAPLVAAATDRDAAPLAELAARTFFEAFAADNDPDDMRQHLEKTYTPERHLEEIRNPAIDTLLMRIGGGAPVAYAQFRSGTASDGVPADGSVELWRFYVDQPWHGRGLAQVLMAAAKARARERGASRLWLGVWERNARAQAFYAKHGFRKVGQQIYVVGSDPQTDDVLLCELAP